MKYPLAFDIELRKNPYNGLYIAIEGADGSGKSTQISRLREYFEEQGRKVITTSEPNDSLQIGSFIRKVLQGDVAIPSVSIQYLMSADRADNHENVVYPALKAGSVVISHRSFWSAIPYGLLDKGITLDKKKEAQALVTAQGILSLYHQFIVPDITFYLAIPLDQTMERMKHRGGKQEIYEKRNKIEKIIAGYTFMIQMFPETFSIVDASCTVDEVTNAMINIIQKGGVSNE